MAEDRPVVQVSTSAVVISVVALLATVVALAAINTGVAIMLTIFLMVFGGELLEYVTTESAIDVVSQSQSTIDGTGSEDALELLRRRYASGELSDEAFERKLETLVETETIADVETHVAETADGTNGWNDGGTSPADLDRDVDSSLERR